MANTDFIIRSNVTLIEQEAMQVAHRALHDGFNDVGEAFDQWLARYVELLGMAQTDREREFLGYADCCMQAILH